MRLSADELLKLKKDKQLKVWRLEEPARCEVGQRYTTAGEYFTVMDVKALSKGALFRHFPKVYEELAAQMSGDVWVVLVMYGDRTDQPRLLAPTGTGADYTNLPARAMPGEPEALRDYEVERYAGVAVAAKEVKRASRFKRMRGK